MKLSVFSLFKEESYKQDGSINVGQLVSVNKVIIPNSVSLKSK